MIRIFVDTSIVRFNENKRTEWISEPENVHWGSTIQEIEVHKSSTVNPQDRLSADRDGRLLKDIKVIPEIKKLAEDGLIRLYWHQETKFEYSWYRPISHTMDKSFTSLISEANDPVFYGRMIAGSFHDEDEQLQFLRTLGHPEYEKWKKAVGVVEGSKKEKNQLMDAWNLWTAEHNHCDYFLTMDYKLMDSIASRNVEHEIRICDPSQFLRELKILLPALKKEKKAWARIEKVNE